MPKLAIILGNGTSLNRMPVSLFEHDSFGMNYAKYQPKFYVCIDETILKNHSTDILGYARSAELTFLSAYQKDWPSAAPLYALPNVRLVDKDTDAFKAETWMSGGTATYVALKLAYYMGYDEVHLWGVDHSVNWEHYRPDYPDAQVQGREREYHMNMMERHYWLAAQVYKQAGKRILNFSDPSRLDGIFERGG